MEYGGSYERVRLAKGYSVGDSQVQEKVSVAARAKQEEEDYTYMASQISDFSVANCTEALTFLDQLLLSKRKQMSNSTRGRALIVLFLLRRRIVILTSDPYTSLPDSEGLIAIAMTDVSRLVVQAVNQFLDAKDLKDAVDGMSQTICGGVLAQASGRCFRDLDPDVFKGRLLDFVSCIERL